MKSKFISLIFLSFCLFACASNVGRSPEFGSWESVSHHSCKDYLYFDGSDKFRVRSGEQELTIAYLISELENTDFLEMNTIIIESNSKPDCLGNQDGKVGTESVFIIKFKNDNQIHFYAWAEEEGYLDMYWQRKESL